MASVIFDVTPEELESSANRIEEKSKEFVQAYNNIYTAVADLRVSYKGEASDSFNQKIEGYKDNFINTDKRLANYVQFIRDYAKLIRKAEEEIKAQVR